MLFSNLVLVVAASSASALELAHVHQRDLTECRSVIEKNIKALVDSPTPASGLIDVIAQQTQFATVTDPCQLPDYTGTMASEYSEYLSSVTDWQKSYKTEIEEYVSACDNELDTQVDELGLTNFPNIQPTVCDADEYYWASETDKPSAGNRRGNTAFVAVMAAGLAGVRLL